MHGCMRATTLLVMSMAMIGPTAQASQSNPTRVTFRWSVAGKIDNAAGVPMPIAGPLVGVVDGRLIIAGGTRFPDAPPWAGGKKAYYDEVHAYTDVGGEPVAVGSTAKLPYPVAYSANVSAADGIVAAGGQNLDGPTAGVLWLRWNAARGTLSISRLPDLPHPAYSGLIAAIGDDVYFAGGNGKDATLAGVYRLDLQRQKDGWKLVTQLPIPVSHGVMYATGAGPHAALYVVGGRTMRRNAPSAFHASVYRLDLATHTWSREAPLPYPLSAFTGVTWHDSTLLVFSGDHGGTFHKVETLLLAIAKAPNARAKQALTAKKNDLLKHHKGFKGTVLAYDTRTNTWANEPAIPLPGQVTTTATTWNGSVVIAGGELRPGIRSADIVLGTAR